MRALILLLGLSALALQAQAPRPQPPPPPLINGHGPYSGREGWFCYQGDTVEDKKRVHCACKAPCENDGMEDRTCLTHCTSRQCLCHTDEACH